MTQQTVRLPAPPPPTREEQEERARRWREERDREERERAEAAERTTQEAIEGAKSALARLIAADEERQRAGARPPEGIPGVEYEFVDLTSDRARSAQKAWDADLAVVRNLDSDDDSLTRWRVSDIEEPGARAFVDRFVRQLRIDAKKKNLIVVGSVGAGKTATAIAAGHLAVELGIRTRYVSHAQYLEYLRPEGAPPGGLRKDEYRKALIAAPLLVLDDFCADMNTDVPASEFARRETINLLNARMTQGKANIVTTNLTTEQVRKVMDDRIASRLGTNAVVVTMADKDRRQPLTW